MITIMFYTQMNFIVTGNTTLKDLLALQLHLFEDEVRNIVDKAVKEMALEKVLQFSSLQQCIYKIIISYVFELVYLAEEVKII